MPDLAITDAPALLGADTEGDDLFPIIDSSASAGSKGKSITREELGEAMLLTQAISDAIVTIDTPKVVYVDAANGNNATAEIGNPAKPFATFAAAYAAGVALAANFALQFGVGTYEYTPSESEASFNYCARMAGAGIALTSVTINGSRPTVTNQNGGQGYNVIQVQVDNLNLTITALGAGVEETDSNTYNCGDGGDVTIYGNGKVATILCNGGSEAASTGANVNPGSGGVITLRNLDCRSLSYSVAQGTGGGGGSASDGELLADGCDLRGTSNTAGVTTLGRCSYDQGLFSITNDKGGNAAY